MKNIKVNNVQFRGQFGEAFEKFSNGKVITINDFKNGKWEATSKVDRFLKLLDEANIKYENTGESLRTASIKLIK